MVRYSDVRKRSRYIGQYAVCVEMGDGCPVASVRQTSEGCRGYRIHWLFHPVISARIRHDNKIHLPGGGGTKLCAIANVYTNSVEITFVFIGQIPVPVWLEWSASWPVRLAIF